MKLFKYVKAKEGNISGESWIMFVKTLNQDSFNWRLILRSPFTVTGTYVNPATFAIERKTKLRKVWSFQLRKSILLNKFRLYRTSFYDKA